MITAINTEQKGDWKVCKVVLKVRKKMGISIVRGG